CLLSRTKPVPDVWYVLIGISGLEALHTWISIPICFMYTVAVTDIFLVFLIMTEHSLHESMYLFLSMLALADVLVSKATVPKMLFCGCVSQIFFIHFIFVAESAILLAIAFDHYVAICYPLKYTTILTSMVIGKIGIAATVWSFLICCPFILLINRLLYCGRKILPHSYCEHMGIARLTCDNINVNTIYGLIMALLSTGLDVMLIVMSYMMILHTVFQIPSWTARLKALNTCASHICVILIFYTPAFFSCFAHHFGGETVPCHIHILMANLYVVVPPMLNPIIYSVKAKQIQN
uniref:G-protein coupled receptors family 1 profile domain-containing protein n=1 Tax=Cavia porcellus TaxID=10141 RepID=H0VY88_CAVPO